MKLSLGIIADRMRPKYSCRLYGHADEELSRNRPRLYRPGSEMTGGELYLGTTEALQQAEIPEDVALICVGGHIPPRWSARELPVLSVSGDVVEVFEAVQAIFDSFDAWDYAMLSELAKGEDMDIRRLIFLGSEILGNPLYVCNVRLQMLFSTQVRLNDDGSLHSVELHDELVDPQVEMIVRVKEPARFERGIDHPYISSLLVDGNRSYCFNLKPTGHYVGCIWLRESSHPFRDGDFLLADHFYAYFLAAFKRWLYSGKPDVDTGSSLLQKLLTHTMLTEEELEQLRVGPPAAWRCFKLRRKPGSCAMPESYLYASLSAVLPSVVHAVIYQNAIVGIVQASPDNEETVMDIFRDLLRQMDYLGGISLKMRDIRQFDAYFLQASYAVSEGPGRDKNEALYDFSEYGLQYLLQVVSGKVSVPGLIPDGLAALDEHDRKKNTEYVRTLDVYLRDERSLTRTSEDLFIHRSSLIKRLEKIRQILKMDLEDPKNRLYLQLYLCLRQMD